MQDIEVWADVHDEPPYILLLIDRGTHAELYDVPLAKVWLTRDTVEDAYLLLGDEAMHRVRGRESGDLFTPEGVDWYEVWSGPNPIEELWYVGYSPEEGLYVSPLHRSKESPEFDHYEAAVQFFEARGLHRVTA
jgi:hypothetical protein